MGHLFALLFLTEAMRKSQPEGSTPSGGPMRLFNSFQIVAAFVAWPFLISWLQGQTFTGAGPAFYAACALYVVAFGAMVGSVYTSTEKAGW